MAIARYKVKPVDVLYGNNRCSLRILRSPQTVWGKIQKFLPLKQLQHKQLPLDSKLLIAN